MKRLIFLLSVIVALSLISWGFKGHKAIAGIAIIHLHFNVIPEVSDLLDGQSMAEVASWADEVRSTPEYKETAPWHFLNLPMGLSYDQFKIEVVNQEKPNIYHAIIKCEDEIANNDLSKKERQEALKFLIHLVGDAHQPMHISRAEDKGGNTIQVRFDDRGTNLHSVWDTKLIDHEGLSDGQIVKDYDKANDEQIKQWQKDDIITWLWESYQISTKLYAEVEISNNLNEGYYASHIEIVHKRIDQAGIRLAGILNKIFKNGNKVKVTLTPPPPIETSALHAPTADLDQVASLIGQTVFVKGKVYGYKELKNMALIDLGAPFPNQLLTIVLKGDMKSAYHTLDFTGKTIQVEGPVTSYKGKPQIVLTAPYHIGISPD